MLPRQLKQLQFASGLNTKGDERAQPEQLLDIATNVEFDDIGGLRVRFPFDSVRTALVGGGTLSNPRKLAMLGDELVCFTSTALYSWVPALSAWEYRGDHLAVATDEETVFATPGDQDYVDRAELNGHIVYCWQTAADGVRIAVRDKASGAVVQPPTSIRPNAGTVYVQPRLVALASCVLLFWIHFVPLGTTTLMCAKITVNPYAYVANATPIASITGAVSTFFYDVARVPGADRCLAALADSGTPTGYTITSVDSAFAGAQTLGVEANAPAPYPIAIAISPDAAFCTVVQGQQAATPFVTADIWNVTAAGVPLTNVIAGHSLDIGLIITGTAFSQITAAYRLTQDGGQYRCYAFWSYGESSTTAFQTASNWIDATGTTGAAAQFVYALGIGARAFAHDSHVYLVGTFAGLSIAFGDPTGTKSELQNTYYLYRDDAFLVAKAVWGEGGGFHASGWLPTVHADADNANAMLFMGAIRRIVPVASNAAPSFVNYAERAPREIAFTFDDDRARRCVQFGETLYVLGGMVLQYDGVQLVELGTCTYPWILGANAGGAGAIPAGGYSYKATDRWQNAKGEVDRSTTGTVINFTQATTREIQVLVPNLYVTRKTGVALEVWRTAVNPAKGAPFFLATSQDPSVVTGANAYLTSDPTTVNSAALNDNLTDAQLTILTANAENEGVLPNIEPPPATIAYADSQRIYLAGIPGYPNTVYYSKYRQTGAVAAFNDALTFDVPAEGGAITAIGALDGALVVWCENATYQFAGAGFDDTGGGSNFQLARILSKDLGCIGPENYAFFDGGFLVKTNKGWFVLGRDLAYQYVGQGPAKYDAEMVVAMTVLTARHQVRVLTYAAPFIPPPHLVGGVPVASPPVPGAARMLVFDTLVGQWAESSIPDGLDMLLWNGTPTYLTDGSFAAAGVRAELATWDGYAGTDYTLTLADIETGWIKFGDSMQSRVIVDLVQLLGELRSTCVIRKRLARDYQAVSEGVWNYHTDVTWPSSSGTIGSALQTKQAPKIKRCESIKARFTITAPDGVSPLGGPCARLTAISLQYAFEPNAYSAMAAAQKD